MGLDDNVIFSDIQLYHSVQFSRSLMSDSFWSHGLQHVRLPCPSPIPGAYSNSCPTHQWCHPTISSSVCPLLLLSSVFPSIRAFSKESVLRIRQPKYPSFSISPSNEYSGLISFIYKAKFLFLWMKNLRLLIAVNILTIK